MDRSKGKDLYEEMYAFNRASRDAIDRKNRLYSLYSIVLIVIALAVGFMLFAWIAASVDRYTCEILSKETGYPVKYSIWTSCMIDPGNGYVPVDNWRVVDE